MTFQMSCYWENVLACFLKILVMFCMLFKSYFNLTEMNIMESFVEIQMQNIHVNTVDFWLLAGL